MINRSELVEDGVYRISKGSKKFKVNKIDGDIVHYNGVNVFASGKCGISEFCRKMELVHIPRVADESAAYGNDCPNGKCDV